MVLGAVPGGLSGLKYLSSRKIWCALLDILYLVSQLSLLVFQVGLPTLHTAFPPL